jgi:hypothetical protein
LDLNSNSIAMKTKSITLLCLFLFIISETEIKAQETKGIYDTIHIYGKGNKKKYTVEGTKIGNIELAGLNPAIVHKLAKIGGDLVGEGLTSLTGIGFGGTREVEFVYPGHIITHIPYYEWQMNVYCDGSITTERNRVKNSDGSHSVQTTEQRSIYWERGAKGIIIEKGDTIGRYQIISSPNSEPKVDEYISIVTARENENGYSIFSPTWKYIIYGDLRGKECAILYNSAEKIIYCLVDNDLIGITLTNDYSTRYKRKHRIEIKLLAQEYADENQRNDILRMAMFGQFLLLITP